MTTFRLSRVLVLVTLSSFLAAGVLNAGSIAVPVTGAAVSAHSLEESQPVFVLDVTLPEEIMGKRLDGAFLEFYVDASLLGSAEIEHVPSIDVRALKEAYAGSGEPTVVSDRGRSRAILVGTGRRVRVDITDVVKGWIADPKSNLGLVVGSLTGSREGDFTLRDDVLDGNAVAKITFIFQNRFGERVSSRK